ncbi:hypothetical protein SNE510_72520 [Streptomyces sp. NE5-10]|nr:hypothetical protein SNE510_72520 [Streptomyces sp. NE5-10]
MVLHEIEQRLVEGAALGGQGAQRGQFLGCGRAAGAELRELRRVRGVRRGSGSVRAGPPMYELLHDALAEFLGGVGVALSVFAVTWVYRRVKAPRRPSR